MFKKIFIVIMTMFILYIPEVEAEEIPLVNGFDIETFSSAFNNRKIDNNELRFQRMERYSLDDGKIMYKGFLIDGHSWINFFVRGDKLLSSSVVIDNNNYQSSINSFYSALRVLGVQTSREEFWKTISKVYNTKEDIGWLADSSGERVWKCNAYSLPMPEGELIMVEVFR